MTSNQALLMLAVVVENDLARFGIILDDEERLLLWSGERCREEELNRIDVE